MRIKHVIGIAFTCMVFIFSCQAQSSTESHAGKNKQEQKKYLGSKPCIIDFYATWCGPCRKLAPILEEIAGEYAGKIDVYKIDVDKEPELAAAFGVQSIPTLLFCPMKNQPQIAAGFMDKATLQKAIKEVLLVK